MPFHCSPRCIKWTFFICSGFIGLLGIVIIIGYNVIAYNNFFCYYIDSFKYPFRILIWIMVLGLFGSAILGIVKSFKEGRTLGKILGIIVIFI